MRFLTVLLMVLISTPASVGANIPPAASELRLRHGPYTVLRLSIDRWHQVLYCQRQLSFWQIGVAIDAGEVIHCGRLDVPQQLQVRYVAWRLFDTRPVLTNFEFRGELGTMRVFILVPTWW